MKRNCWVRVLWLCFLGHVGIHLRKTSWGGITSSLLPRRFQPDRIIETRANLEVFNHLNSQKITDSNGIMFPNFRLNQQIPTQNHLSTKTHQPTTKKNKQNTEPKVHPPKKTILLLSVSFLFSWSFSSPPLLLAFRSLPAVSPQPPSAASPAAATIRRASAGGRRGPWRRPRCEDEELQRPPKCWSREGGRPVKVWRCSNFLFVS